jgi:hypothetical protein
MRLMGLYPDRFGLDSPPMTDDGGVLGNLPRSRPGQRSEKRTGAKRAASPAKAGSGGAKAGRSSSSAAKAASRAERSAAPAAEKAPGSEPRSRARPKPAAGPRQAAGAAAGEDQATARGGDPVGDAIRTVTGIATTGARVAGGVAREVLRRLPRP